MYKILYWRVKYCYFCQCNIVARTNIKIKQKVDFLNCNKTIDII